MDKRIISEIWIYPVKSLGGIRVASSEVMIKGLRYDRRWMLIDKDGMFMTQREHPSMALFKTSVNEAGIAVHHSGDEIIIPFHTDGAVIRTSIWEDSVDVEIAGQEVSNWFSKKLGMECRLVSFPEKNPRPVDAAYSIRNEQVSLADGYPLLIIGQSSLDDLNRRMKTPLPMNRFRPNIVFTGGESFEEDEWKNFKAGDCRFAAVKPCARCALTTVNQDTAEKGIEPLATLASYRRKDNNVYFGQNVLTLQPGKIAVGDEIIFG